jgi:hypothetical protein
MHWLWPRQSQFVEGRSPANGVATSPLTAAGPVVILSSSSGPHAHRWPSATPTRFVDPRSSAVFSALGAAPLAGSDAILDLNATFHRHRQRRDWPRRRHLHACGVPCIFLLRTWRRDGGAPHRGHLSAPCCQARASKGRSCKFGRRRHAVHLNLDPHTRGRPCFARVTGMAASRMP